MRLKGIDKLREKLPDYPGNRIYIFHLIVIISALSSIFFQLFFDSLSRLFPGILVLQFLEPLTPLLGSVIVLMIGFLIVYMVWRKKDKYLDKYKEKAYQKALKFGAIGIPMVMSVMVHSFMPFDLLARYNEGSIVSIFLSTAIDELIFGFSFIFFLMRIAFFLFFLLLGFLVFYRAITVFGVDYMCLVYLYYPDESKIQESEIYSILRHPTYHALLLLFTSSLFLRFSLYSVAYFFIIIIGFNFHLKFVEEKELIQRFGEGYKNYMKEVPALFVRFRDLGKYFRHLFSKSQ